MKFLNNITGIAGSEFAAMLALGAATFLMTGEGLALDVINFTTGNF